MTRAIMPSQVSTTLDLIKDGSHRVESPDHHDQNKWVVWEERLRVVKGFDVYDPVKATGICLVPDLVVPKNFRVPKFVKYMGLECPNTRT